MDEEEFYDIEICFTFKDKRNENQYFKASGKDEGPDGIKDIARDIIKKRKLEGIESIFVTDYNDYDEENECYYEYELWI